MKRRPKVWMGVCSFLLTLSPFLAGSCSGGPSAEQTAKADQLIEAAHKARDYQQLTRVVDMLEAEGSLTQARALYWRGYASDRTNHLRMAEFYYNTALKAAGTDDPETYAKAASHQANLMALRGDYENGLKFATPIVRQLEELQCDTTSDYVNLLIYIGCCQAGLGSAGEATADGFDKAYQKHLDNVAKNRTDEAYKDAIAGLINITFACNYAGQYREALKWNGHFGELLNEYSQRPGINAAYVDKQQARYNLYQAQAFEGLGNADEAAKAFDAFLTTDFAKTPEGRILSNDYLIAAKRWGEAADNYQSLDALQEGGDEYYTLQYIQDKVLKKYQANLLAGRRDSAVALSMLLCDSLTVALDRAKAVDAEEQAVIVSRVEEMSEQQTASIRRHQRGVLGLLALLFIAVVGYIFYRRYHHHQLRQAHDELRQEYEELEEAATERSRTETEQRIAAAIQHYVAPDVLPKRDDLSLLVSQTPGTMAGGSFCDCLTRGDTLLFFIGSAVGEGVSAATSSAMAWAQCRTAAMLLGDPSRIIGAVSEALADGRHLPVRLFVGTLDLTTGELQYANAGHPTPLLWADELALLPGTDDSLAAAGEVPGEMYPTLTATLGRGHLLYIYTDGVARATDGEGRELGDSRLRGMALQAVKLSPRPKPFLDNITKAIDTFTAGTPQALDRTMMVLARK